MHIPALLVLASHLTHQLAPAAPPAQGVSSAGGDQPSAVSPYADNDFPTLLRNLRVRSTDLLEASLSVEDRGAKLTYAPFLYGLINYRPVLSETRLSVAQSNGVTTLGVGATYDPTAPRSGLGSRLWEAKAPTSKPAAGYESRLREHARLQGQLLHPVDLGGYVVRAATMHVGQQGAVPGQHRGADALTPLLDIRVTKAAQFRFGVPLKFTRTVSGTDGKEVELVAVDAIQIGAPK